MEQRIAFSLAVSFIVISFNSTCISNAYENLPLNASAWQSNPYPPHISRNLYLIALSHIYVLGQNVVDGLKSDLTRWSGQCAISENNIRAATIWVDLKSVLSINHVKVYYRTDNVKWENIAMNKPSWQSSQFYPGDQRTDASNAVDGLKTDQSAFGGQCVISNTKHRTATWWVNLTSILSIHHITVYYRTDNIKWGPSHPYTKRFLGFYLYVSNTTYRNDGYLCFHDTNYTRATIPPVLNISCPVHGQYVIYYNERLEGVKYPADYSHDAFTELCEVEVYGCHTSGFFGPNCDLRCHTNCQEYCNIETGVCLGCKPGYVGQYCEKECSERRFGQNCEEFCGDCVDFEQCHHVNGKCQNGCERGFHGTRCTEMCPVGFYDKNCSKKCSPNCFYFNRCDSKSGVCQGGCKPGWEGLLCDKDCNEKNGTNCNIRCGHCRGGVVCNQMNGACPNGCAAGYKGEICTIECDVGWYGLDCRQKCSAYCNDSGVCDHVTGSCEGGCKSGWQGMNCLEEETNITGNIEYVNPAYTCDTSHVFISLFSISIVGVSLLAVYIFYLRRRISQQPVVSNSQEDCDKTSTVENIMQKEKMYDTLGSDASRTNEKNEEINMSLQSA